ncbi:NuoI/complex I 23 kDa subunit family protein [Sinosporangium album]|uniref:NuoI/complex I 23 kDa subunit family protein n=1 Tax=Sinosporangium album TaxID=504805 RepID=UPI000B86E4FE|nr:NADH-quinone oxidoreductase subunit I [Sinosporangium album]
MAHIPGEGLAKGLAVTLRHMLDKSVTQQYPEVQPDLPPRSRGVIALVEENCTVCMLCARECPDWCIYIDSHKETLPAPEGGRPRARNVLDRFAIDFSLCMYCGICIEVCPFDALFWAPDFEYAEHDILDLLHEKERLGSWVESVPPPPPHEVGAEPPKEVAGGGRPARESRTAPARAAQSPGASQPVEQPSAEEAASPRERPRARTAPRDVRGIRPPGALPAKPAPDESVPDEPEAAKPAPAPPSDRASGEERPRRRLSPRDVRNIRPPGALPAKPPASEPEPPGGSGPPDPGASKSQEPPEDSTT